MIEILELREEYNNLWEDFLKNNEESKFYHSVRFKEVIEKTYKNCAGKYFFILNDKKVSAIFPFFFVKSKIFGNRLISLPFLDSGGFIGTYKKEDLTFLLEELKKIKDLDEIEIKLNTFMENYGKNGKILSSLNFVEKNNKNQIFLKIEGADAMRGNLSRITKKGIKKAEKSNLRIEEITNEEELKRFYSLYENNMKSFGSPQHSYQYFLNLFSVMKNNFRGLNCYKESKLISSLIVFFSKNYIHAAFNPSDGDYLVYQPNDLLHWETIKWAEKKGVKYFDIGQCDIDAQNDTRAGGILRFKKKWNGVIYEKKSFLYYINNNKKTGGNSKLKRFSFLWKKLPIFFTRVVGPKINSQLGV